MAKDWKQVAKALKREIRALKAMNKEHFAKGILAGQEIALLEKRVSVLQRGWEKNDAKLQRIRDLIK